MSTPSNNNASPETEAHSQTNQAAFTTTDASGYPDRLDGLSALGTTTTSQDIHEHHKHTQVQEESTVDHKDEHCKHHHLNPFHGIFKKHGECEEVVAGHTASGHLHNHKSPIGTTYTEMQEQLQDPSMRSNDCARINTVPNFIR
ncbi:hypothetical protein BGZ76_005794 [Entomortierella beljakovae]|nr:hypothetical protein BGZ76_005794 [Entomortierella beljakovae]